MASIKTSLSLGKPKSFTSMHSITWSGRPTEENNNTNSNNPSTNNNDDSDGSSSNLVNDTTVLNDTTISHYPFSCIYKYSN